MHRVRNIPSDFEVTSREGSAKRSMSIQLPPGGQPAVNYDRLYLSRIPT